MSDSIKNNNLYLPLWAFEWEPSAITWLKFSENFILGFCVINIEVAGEVVTAKVNFLVITCDPSRDKKIAKSSFSNLLAFSIWSLITGKYSVNFPTAKKLYCNISAILPGMPVAYK